MKIPPVKLYFPPEDIVKIQEDVKKILESGMLTLGEYTRRFEKKFAQLSQTKFAVATNSGTSALEIILRSLPIPKSAIVLVPTNTFTATAATVILSGHKLKLIDVNPVSACLSLKAIEANLNPKPAAIIVVHIGGLMAPEIFEIREYCTSHGIYLVEDAAHAQGSIARGSPAGSLGIAGAFSFYPTKVITSGEGGMVVTNDKHIYEEGLRLRDQGKDSFLCNDIVRIGNNWRLPEISAAVGLRQLKRLDKIIQDRTEAASYFEGGLAEIPSIETRDTPNDFRNNYYKYILYTKNRDRLSKFLNEQGISCSGAVYDPPLHLQPIYRNLLGMKEGDLPNAEMVSKTMLCLPMFKMTQEEKEYIVNKIKECEMK